MWKPERSFSLTKTVGKVDVKAKSGLNESHYEHLLEMGYPLECWATLVVDLDYV